MKYHGNQSRHPVRQTGFSIMEVLIGIGIFAIGMLALASFQGALTRSTAEAKVRTEAINIAEEIIEAQRGFSKVLTTAGVFDYGDIRSSADPFNPWTPSPLVVTRNNVTYTVTQVVSEYYYDLLTDSFTETKPTGTFASDYKSLAVTVVWSDDREFIIQEGVDTGDTGVTSDARLGGGSIQVSAIISSVSVAAIGKVAEATDGEVIAPNVTYTPGLKPEIISLSLDGEGKKFKESLTPEPEVFRENLETRFDVVTYSQLGGSSNFLRREEFVAVSCECKLLAADASNQGKTPTIWAGDEYTEPEFVTKPYGVVDDSVAQSPLCDICCRDHHDVSGSSDKAYDPSRPLGEYSSGNHRHYTRDRVDPLKPTLLPDVTVCGTPGNPKVCETYVEACRLVRKDGFFRVAQDFRLEGLNTFPEDFLITKTEVARYSDYVIGEVYKKSDRSSYVADAIDETASIYQLSASPPEVDTAPRKPSGAGTPPSSLTLGFTRLPTAVTLQAQQLRSRGIYIDNMSNDLLWVLECLETSSGTDDEKRESCKKGDVELDQTGSVNILEIIPFFELQTTFLNDWEKGTPDRLEFEITRDLVETGNTHDRGRAINNVPINGPDMARARANRGVSGLSSTERINNVDYELKQRPSEQWAPGEIEVITGVGDTTPEGGKIIKGELVSVKGPRLASVLVTASEAVCNYITGTGEFTCFVPGSATDAKMILTGYDKSPKRVYVCSDNPTELPVTEFGTIDSPTSDVGLGPAAAGTVYVITLTTNSAVCSGG